MSKFPKTLYARMEEDDDRCHLAFEDKPDAIDNDGPTVVGTYQLIGTSKLHKIVEEVK